MAFGLGLFGLAAGIPPVLSANVQEDFVTDPVASGRFVSRATDTESAFAYQPATRALWAVLDVDSAPAYYLSQPFPLLSEQDDVTFSVRFRVEAIDPRAKPTSYLGLMTDTHAQRGGDGLTINVSTTGGRPVCTARIDHRMEGTEGQEIPLELGVDYLAYAHYTGERRELSLRVYAGSDFLTPVGAVSTALWPSAIPLTLALDRMGVQNGGGQVTDSDVGSITLTIDDLFTPGVPPLLVSVAGAGFAEGQAGLSTVTLEARLSRASTGPVAFEYLTRDGTARAGDDYVATRGVLTFVPGVTTRPIPVQLVGDRVIEADESFELVLTNAVNASLLAGQALVTITNDDWPAIEISDAADWERHAGTNGFRFDVRLNTPGLVPAQVSYITVDASAQANGDYESQQGVLTFEPGETAKSIAIRVNGDTIEEDDETFLVRLERPVRATLGEHAVGQGLIRDDDRLPEVSVQDTSVQERTAIATYAVIQVTLSHPATGVNAVTCSTTNGTAVAGEDYLATARRLEFQPGETSQRLEVAVIGDALHEGPERFQVRLDEPAGGRIERGVADVLITDDDGPPRLAIADTSVVEGHLGHTNAEFRVRLSHPTVKPVSVTAATVVGTATSPSDYLERTDTLHFIPGATQRMFVVSVVGDTVDEPSETFSVRLSGAINADLEVAEAIGTIIADDGVTVSVFAGGAIEGDVGLTDLECRVELSAASSQVVEVNLQTADGTALAATDYEAHSSRLRFLPGETSKRLGFAVRGDLSDEINEVFYANLSRPTNATLAVARAVCTIVDDDPPELRVEDLEIEEGDSGATDAVFTVRLTTAAEQVVTARYATGDGTARAGSDYDPGEGTLTFEPGLTALEVRVTVIGDTRHETDEQFFLHLFGPQNAIVGRSPARATILNDDEIMVVLEDWRIGECDQGQTEITIPVSLSGPSDELLWIPFATVDGTAVSGRDYQGIQGQLPFQPGQTTNAISIKVNCDLLAQGDRFFFLDFGGGDGFDGSRSRLTIVDNDPPSLLVADAAFPERHSGIVYRELAVRLSRVSTQHLSVDYITAPETALTGQDFLFQTGTLVFSPGLATTNLLLPIVGDTRSEGDETFVVRFSNPANVEVPNPTARITILDDDLPAVAIDDAEVAEGHVGMTNLVFTLTLSAPLAQPVTVDYATTNRTARAGTDYVATAGRVTIPPGAVSANLVVEVQGDLETETDETFVLGLNHPTNAVPTRFEAIGTIRDDDAPPVILTSESVTFTEGDSGDHAATFAFTLSRPSALNVSFDYTIADGTTTRGLDYFHIPRRVAFAAGSTNALVAVTLKGDTICEEDETFFLTLANESGATLERRQVQGIISNDDPLPEITAISVTALEGNTGARSFPIPVRLTRASSRLVTVDFQTADQSATAGSDYTPTQGRLTFEPGRTNALVEVSVQGDLWNEPDESFLLRLSGSTPTARIKEGEAVVTILNDDGRVLDLAPGPTLVEGHVGSTTARFQIALSGPASQPITVEAFTTDGTATSEADYRATVLVVSLPPGETSDVVEVPVFGDLVDEADETFGLELRDPSGAVIGVQRAVATILDDDPPELSVGDEVVSAAGGPVTARLRLGLTSVSPQPVQVKITTVNGDATAGQDFEARAETVIIPAGQTHLVVEVAVKGNTVDEGDEEFYLDLSDVQNARVTDARGVCRILNLLPANRPPTVALELAPSDPRLEAPLDVGVRALAQDTDGRVVNVEFYRNGTLFGQATSEPFEVFWPAVQPGTYSLTARATDDDGETGTSAPVTLTVQRPAVDCWAVIYANDFERPVQGEWSVRSTEVAPASPPPRRFLGRLLNQHVTLRLTNLPPHSLLRLSFDVLVLQAWMGNDPATGPDVWSVRLDDQAPLFETTFAFQARQAFPESFPGGDFPARSGASEHGTLGYQVENQPADAVYRLTRYVAHTEPSLALDFSAAGLASLDASSWGLDNVRIEMLSSASPVITEQPKSQEAPLGGTVTFRVAASSLSPVTYQWRHNRRPLDGGTQDTLRLTDVQPAQEGQYDVVVSSCAGDSPSQPAALLVRIPRHPPNLGLVPDQTTFEDTALGPVTFGVSDAESPPDTLRVSVVAWPESLLPNGLLLLGGTGTDRNLRLTPAPQQYGQGTVLLAVTDTDGMTNSATFQVRVLPVNDPPSFRPGPDVVVHEDAPATNLPGWATALSPGPPNEQGQQLTFIPRASQPGLYAQPLALSPTGTLTFAPAQDAFGTNSVVLVLRDNGGTEWGGVDAVTNQFVVAIQAVNDPPTLAPIPSRTHRINAPPQTVSLAGITTGATNETQVLDLSGFSDNPALVPHPNLDYRSPAPTGLLTYHPNPERSGVATITVTARDDGGSALGGNDQIQRQFRITVQPNLPPTVSLTSPTNGQTFAAPATVTVRASAEDPDGAIAKVEFFEKGSPLGEARSDPYQFTWAGVPSGDYELRARATDQEGATADSAIVGIRVREALGLTLTSPVGNAIYCPYAPIIFAATVQGPLPAGSSVEFRGEGTLFETASSAPFTVLRRPGLSGGAYRVHARLVDDTGMVHALSQTNTFQVLELCGDVAILQNYEDLEVARMVELLTDDLMLRFVRNGVDVFSQGEPTLERLLGYKLIIWAGLARVGEGLTDAEVDLFWNLRSAGKSLYLIGPNVLSDTARLSAAGAARYAQLANLRPVQLVQPNGVVLAHPSGYGDPIFQTTPGGYVLPPATFGVGAVQPGELIATNGYQVKLSLDGAPVMAVAPPVCDLDQGQARLATQSLGLEDSTPSRNLFKNTALWLLRGWYCENFELQLTVAEGPADGKVGQELVYEYHVGHSGACGAAGVTLSEELPPGWVVSNVELVSGVWEQVGPWLFVTLGCMDQAIEHPVRFHLSPTQPGTYTHTVLVRAEAEPFSAEKHLRESITGVTGTTLAPRLELRRGMADEHTLWLFGAQDVVYRIQRSADLTTWHDLQTLAGPQAQMPARLDSSPSGRSRYFRAVWP